LLLQQQIADVVGLGALPQLVPLPGRDSLLNVVQEPAKSQQFKGEY
jgi:hypothetical protein